MTLTHVKVGATLLAEVLDLVDGCLARGRAPRELAAALGARVAELRAALADTTTADAVIVDVVPLGEYLQLARTVYDCRRAQRSYWEAKKRTPHATPQAEWQAVRRAEQRLDLAVRDALARERLPLPGMKGGDLT